MASITARVYGPLNDFLPAEQRGEQLPLTVAAHQNCKDVLEALGVPHVEIAQLFVNGEEASLEDKLHEGDRLVAFPITDLAPAPDEPPRFIIDGHLGALARHLRLLGFDAEWEAQPEDKTLALRSAEEDRVLLTRDVGLLKRSIVTRGYWLRSTDPTTQLAEVVRRFRLTRLAKPFSRCLECNRELVDAPKEAVRAEIPPYVAATQERFRRCTRCAKIFWAGTHHARLQALCDDVLR